MSDKYRDYIEELLVLAATAIATKDPKAKCMVIVASPEDDKFGYVTSPALGSPVTQLLLVNTVLRNILKKIEGDHDASTILTCMEEARTATKN
jgi:hypothetical protein